MNLGSKWIIRALMAVVGLIFLTKLFWLQVVDTSFQAKAESRAYKKVTKYPVRGLIYDRHGELVVYNDVLYDLNVIPRQTQAFDTAHFCDLIGIEKEYLKEKFRELRKKGRSFVSSLFLKQIDPARFGRFQEFAFKFPGFYGTVRTVRRYPHGVAAHVLGDIGEVNETEIENSEGYYRPGDYLGKSGIEKTYEQQLRGERGVDYVLVDRLGREVGKMEGGNMDSAARAGERITSTLDIQLQAYAEQLMQNKRGSVVAIEPATGEVLCFVSSPSYDPNLLVGRKRGENFLKLQRDSSQPLFLRPLLGTYPPGSTYKPIMAAIALQEQVIASDATYPCRGGGYTVGTLRVGCHEHAFISDVNKAVQYSCNAYFCHVFRAVMDDSKFNSNMDGYRRWEKINRSFGLGTRLNIDLPSEKGGLIPDTAYYNRLYNGRWRSSMVLTLGIGQDRMLVTPVQLANMAAVLANRGFYYQPHLVKAFERSQFLEKSLKKKYQSLVERRHFETISQGMSDVVNEPGGTARLARVDSIDVCGKTGTAENPLGKDHSIFIAFAPKDNPKIAIGVVVENSGFGGTWAAPIAGLLIEKYLKGKIAANKAWIEERMMKANLLK